MQRVGQNAKRCRTVAQQLVDRLIAAFRAIRNGCPVHNYKPSPEANFKCLHKTNLKK